MSNTKFNAVRGKDFHDLPERIISYKPKVVLRTAEEAIFGRTPVQIDANTIKWVKPEDLHNYNCKQKL